MVLRSGGFRSRPLPGLPFDEHRGIIPNDLGRVIAEDGQPITGGYVAGWIKGGANGPSGTTKHAARETVASIMEDFISGRLRRPDGDRRSLQQLLAVRQPKLISGDGWHARDEARRPRG